MHRSQFPVYHEDDRVYISAFGIETEGTSAYWGPGRRKESIIHYVLKGKGFYNGNPVAEGQGFCIAANSFCEYYPEPEEPWNYFWINCSAEFAQRYAFAAVAPNGNGIFDYDFKGKLQGILEKIFACRHSMSQVEALAYACGILMLHSPTAEVTGSQHYVLQAKNHIENNLNKRISVCDVADALSINDRYLYTLFIRHEGISPKEYILKRKMQTAVDLLKNTELSITEIAAAVGVQDVYGFSRLFKLKLGVSPSQYRNSIKR